MLLYKMKLGIPTMHIANITTTFNNGAILFFSLFSAVFSVGSSFFVSAACFAIGVIITLSNCRTYKEVSGGKNVPGSVGALVALAVSTLILLINPVSDLFYQTVAVFLLQVHCNT